MSETKTTEARKADFFLACSFWQRQQGRDADDNGFGFSPWDLMTPAQAEAHQAARDAEDEKDPPCGKCDACAESQAEDESLPEAYR